MLNDTTDDLNKENERDQTTQNRSSQVQVQFDDSNVKASYANFCRVTGTPEELIIDFGLNTQQVPAKDTPIMATDRIVMNFYSAKRLMFALQATIQRHEQVFGTLEIDVQKRVNH